MDTVRFTGTWERMRGLLGKTRLPADTLYVFPRCGSVHTVGMRIAIDVAFLDKQGRVLSVRRAVRPGRLVFGPLRARTTVECAAGAFPLKVGETLGPGAG